MTSNGRAPDVYFMHIQKTAGTTLAGVLRSAYAPEDVLPVYNWFGLVAMDLSQIRGYRLYMGHFGTGLFSLLERSVACITVLRDPFERTVSQLRYWRRHFADGWVERMTPEMRHDFEPVMAGDWEAALQMPLVCGALRDYQTRSLGLAVDLRSRLGRPRYVHFSELLTEAERGMSGEDVLGQARSALTKCAVVGTVEALPDVVCAAAALVGVDAPDPLPLANADPERDAGAARSYRALVAPSSELGCRIHELTALDRRLYDGVRLAECARAGRDQGG